MIELQKTTFLEHLGLLLPERFGEHAHYFAKSNSREDATILRQFYDRCPNLPVSGVQLFSWHDTARQITKVYEKVLRA